MRAVKSIRPDEIISYNPATGEEVGRVPAASKAEVQAAVERGRVAFQSWRRTSFAERRRLVMRAREIILEDLDGIAHLISRESGKPFGEAISMEIAPVLDLMQHFARQAEKMLRPTKINIGLYALLGRYSRMVYHPLGVIGIIPAWNYPFSIPLGEAAMALMAGNTVIIKPSELTPMVGLKIGEIFEKAGFPQDVVQIITGAGSTGAALVEAAPDKIMFTGSVATGKKIASEAAKTLTPYVLELGGKDPMIVFEDANLDLAARAAVWGAFCNAGQSCSSVERLYVKKSVAAELTRKIVELTQQLKQGVGDAEDVSIGAMSSERQLQIVEDHVDDFLASGAKIEVGGRRSADTLVRMDAAAASKHFVTRDQAAETEMDVGDRRSADTLVRMDAAAASKPTAARDQAAEKRSLADKSVRAPGEKVRAPLFYPPTVITGVTNDMLGMREETFGPTLPIAEFETEDEAIRLANDSPFGLTASVWTRDYARGRRVAQQIEAGSVCVNEVLYTHGIGQTPWGGFKDSGRGRTHGREGLMEMVQPQHIHVNRLAILPNAWWMPYSPTAVETFRGFAKHFATGSVLKTSLLVPQLLRRLREMLKR